METCVKSKTSGNPKSSADCTQTTPRVQPLDPDDFRRLLDIAAKAGVTEFTAGPYIVKFGAGVHAEWQRLNRPVVDR